MKDNLTFLQELLLAPETEDFKMRIFRMMVILMPQSHSSNRMDLEGADSGMMMEENGHLDNAMMEEPTGKVPLAKQK